MRLEVECLEAEVVDLGPVWQAAHCPDHKTIDAYGLRDPAYKGQEVDGIPHPAVYIIDKDGKVSWARIESD